MTHVELSMALKYRVKFGEEQQFLEADEIQALNKYIGTAVEVLGASATQDQKVLAARDAQKKYLTEALPAELIPTRITRFLLTTAVNLRYQTQPGQVSIPRKAEGKQRPGVWWGEIVDHLDEAQSEGNLPTSLPLDPIVLAWLVCTVWQDDKVQNGFPPQLQMWVNTLDEHMEQLAEEIGGGRKK